MNLAFYISAVIAVLTTALAITRRDAVHGVLYLVVSLLAAAVAFLVLGAPFAAALEVITYAGAMMVMLLVALMTLPREETDTAPGIRRPRRVWLGPLLLSVVLAGEFVFILVGGNSMALSGGYIPPGRVGAILFGPYVLAVELASMLLLAGLVGAYHLGKQRSADHSSRSS